MANAFDVGKTVYLSNQEDDDSGFPVYNCVKRQCTEVITNLNRKTSLQVTGREFKAKTIDAFDDSLKEEIFVPVQYSYLRKNGKVEFIEGTGFLPKYALSEKKHSAFFSLEEELNQNRMPAAATAQKKPTPVKAAQEIYDLVGECVIDPATTLPKNLPKENTYDFYVYNKLKKHKLPLIVNERNQQMTAEDLVNIDALARTIYGEMGKCFKKGLQYPMAAALVAVNRYDNKSRYKEWTSSFVKRKVASVPSLTKIITTPEKFNNWKIFSNSKKNGPLHHSLCPPRAVNKPFWKTDKASQDQVDIWKNAVRIATEAVMFPDKFKARSPAMKNINFYTSGLGQYHNYLQVFPFVNDRPLEHFDCIEMWKEPNK